MGKNLRPAGLAIMAGLMFQSIAAKAQCPPGYAVKSHTVVKQGEEEYDMWTCGWAGGATARSALQQLKNMGQGRVDTTTGFDGGQGMSAAVATAPGSAAARSPNMGALTESDLLQFGKDPQFKAANQELFYASTDRKEAQAKATELRQRQSKLTDSLARQQLQIEIAKAEQVLHAAKGAERIAENKVIKEVVRLKPQVIEAKKSK